MIIQDAPFAPEMVVIPQGKFMMGSASDDSDSGRHGNESPQHEVEIAYRFAVGRYPVTFDEFDYFADAMDLHGRRPVIDVSWEGAQGYISWLSDATGHPYRLLSEAEWEYACRAGTTTRYSWSDDITPENANYGRKVDKTSEVGAYPANPWGLHDMHGNVWEWVEDCWNSSYKGAPNDGSAWTSGDCRRRVLRGGSWFNFPDDLRSARRSGYDAGFRYDDVGFRVARTVESR